MIVLDASAAVEWLLGRPHGEAVERRLVGASSIHAPHLLAIEVAQVVRRFTLTGALAADRGEQALLDFSALGVMGHEHEPLLRLVWSMRFNLTAYDAAYVALALALDVPLVTLDRRIAEAPGHGAEIDLIG